tara:strand:- start:59387 stop:60829 length:1443 start_codon:yes stop_codon:yes gene_type:complete
MNHNLFQSSFSLLFLSIVLSIFVPALFMDGMFMDATQYTAVGRNLADGLGSFWRPYFTNKYYINNIEFNFNEQTPLGFALFAAWFKVLGDSLYVERFFILASYLLNIFLMRALWRLVLPSKSNFWILPVFLYGLFPIIFWTYQHNMLENPMASFILLAAYFGILAIQKKEKSNFFAFISGAMIFLAFMVKGVPGLFPLAVFFSYWLWNSKQFNYKRMLLLSSIATFSFLALFGLLFLFEESKASMSFYLEARLLNRISVAPTVGSRFYIISDFLQQIIVPTILVVIAQVYNAKKRVKLTNLNLMYFFITLGLAGVLPIMLTKVQRGFYITPAYPFIAIGLAILIVPSLEKLIVTIGEKARRVYRFLGFVSFLSLIVVTIAFAGKPKRDKQLLEDVYTIGAAIGPGHLLVCSIDFMKEDWSPKSYFMRYFQIEFDALRKPFPANRERRYALFKKGEVVGSNLRPLNLDLKLYTLYEYVEGE